VILSAAYNWFVSQFQPGSHPPAPDNRSAFVSLSNYIAKCYAVMAVNDIRTGKTPKAAQYRAKVKQTKPLTMAINAEYRVGIEAALEAAAAGEPPGKYLAGYQKNHTQQLAAVWDGPGVKMVALQDDLDSLYDVSLFLFVCVNVVQKKKCLDLKRQNPCLPCLRHGMEGIFSKERLYVLFTNASCSHVAEDLRLHHVQPPVHLFSAVCPDVCSHMPPDGCN